MIHLPIFEHFMMGYWNQDGLDLYGSANDAFKEFGDVEGAEALKLLLKELAIVEKKIGFPKRCDLPLRQEHKFWSNFHMVLSYEDYLEIVRLKV